MDEHAKTVRDMVKHENEVTNHRITWLLTTQGFLLAALAFASKNASGLVPYLCILGMVGSILTILNVSFSTNAVSRLVRWWQTNGQKYAGPPVIGVDFKPGSILNYLSPANLFSAVLTITWFMIWLNRADIILGKSLSAVIRTSRSTSPR